MFRQSHRRSGTSLCEVLLALVLLAATAAWGLQAAAAAERALGRTSARRTALHRADRALAELNALPCDSINVVRSVVEPRWSIDARRDHDGLAYSDDVVLRLRSGDTLRAHRGGWCD
jgi:Tfp pilus assembly protein PilV